MRSTLTQCRVTNIVYQLTEDVIERATALTWLCRCTNSLKNKFIKQAKDIDCKWLFYLIISCQFIVYLTEGIVCGQHERCCKACGWIQGGTHRRRGSWQDYFYQAPSYWRIWEEIHCYPRRGGKLNNLFHQPWPYQTQFMGHCRTIKTRRLTVRLLCSGSCRNLDVRCGQPNHLQKCAQMVQGPV